MRKVISLLCSVLVALSALPAYAVEPPAKPVIVQIGAQQASAANIAQGPNKVFLPLIANPKCYALNPLQPGSASANACASLDTYAGAQSLAGYVTTLAGNQPFVFTTDLPSHAVNIPQQTITLGPVSKAPVSTLKVRINAMAFMTETAASAASALVNNPMPARAKWVIENALQDPATSSPTLFPMSILAPHYAQPIAGSPQTIPAAICGQSVGLYIYGFPTNIEFSDATAASGNLWLQMRYPSCRGMDAYPWVRLDNFWRSLQAFPSKYPNLDRDADAGATTYHAAIQVVDAQGRISTMDAVIIVGVVGAVVLIAVFPPAAGGWWLLAGAAL